MRAPLISSQQAEPTAAMPARQPLKAGLVDHRAVATSQRQRNQSLAQSPQAAAEQALVQRIKNSAQVKSQARLDSLRPVVQRQVLEEDKPVQSKSMLQRKAEEEEPVQTKSAGHSGLPAQLKSGIESLSGVAMGDVKVHYNSSKPAQLQAYAYAQGADIHLAPGQEQHLPHEAWHVVQQRQGRVATTVQMAGVAVNDDACLEHEADVMGARATHAQPAAGATQLVAATRSVPAVVQKVTKFNFKTKTLGYDDGTGVAKTTLVGEEAEAWINPQTPIVGTETPKRTGVYSDLDLIQGHLINAQVGGPGILQNFFPITQSMNANHKNNIELPLKYKVLELDHLQKTAHGWANRHLYYRVKAIPNKWAGFQVGDAAQSSFQTEIAYTNANYDNLTSLGVGVGGITATDIANAAHETLDTRLTALGMGATKPTSPSFGVGKTYTQGNPLVGPQYRVGSYELKQGGTVIGVVQP